MKMVKIYNLILTLEAYLDPSQTHTMELLPSQLAADAENFILDV